MTGALALLILTTAPPSPSAVDVGALRKGEGISDDDWQRLKAGDVITHRTPSRGKPPVGEGRGAFIIVVPAQHVFEQLGRVEEMPEYSTCLKAIQVLLRAQHDGGSHIKARETHQSLWMKASYTLDYQEDRERNVIRWSLDPRALHDVVKMSGSWRVVALDDTSTLVLYRISASAGRALPPVIEDYFAGMMMPGYLKNVRAHIEKAHARGEH